MRRKRSPAANDINPATGLPRRIRAPREERVVSSSTQRSGQRGTGRTVPQIRLSGAWLERVGFARGVRFFVLVEAHDQILLALVDPHI